MVGVVVLDVDGEPRWTGNGFAPCYPISVSPDVVGDVAAAKGTAATAAAAAAQSEEAWLDEAVVVAAAAGTVVAMAAAADCLEEDVQGEYGEHPDTKAKAPSDVAWLNPTSKRLVEDDRANRDVQLDVAEVRRADSIGCRQLLVDVLLSYLMATSKVSLEVRTDLDVEDAMHSPMTR